MIPEGDDPLRTLEAINVADRGGCIKNAASRANGVPVVPPSDAVSCQVVDLFHTSSVLQPPP